MLDILVNGVDRGIRALSEAFAGPVHSYCRLETVDNGVLVADDGSLVSLLHLEGTPFRWSLNMTRKAAENELPSFLSRRA